MTAQADKGRQVAAPIPFAVARADRSFLQQAASLGHSLRVDLRGGSYLPATLAGGLRSERTGSARAWATGPLSNPRVGRRRAQALGQKKARGVQVTLTSP